MQQRLGTMIRHFICQRLAQHSLAGKAGATQAVGMLPAAMSEPAPQRFLMTAVSLAALIAPRRLATALTTVNLPAITVRANIEQYPASTAKALAENGFRAGWHRRRGGLDSRGQLLA